TITGPAAADYSVASFPSSVAPSGSQDMVINFTPSASGSRLAAINIANDDPTATNYVINLFGVGGSLASEPTTQPTNLVFSGVKSYEFDADFTAASPAPDGYLVLRRNGVATTDVPVDGVVYERGDVIGNSKVVYSSNATSFTPNSIEASTNYYFAVFAYNGPGVYRNYLQSNPLAGNVSSLGSMQPSNYYSTISTANPTFLTDLHTLVNPHTLQFYSSFGPLVVEKMYERDTTGNQRVVTCSYSGLNKVFSPPFDWTSEDFSREHAYCQSWQVSVNSPTFQSLPEFNDYHNLTPTNQTLVNAIRSNNPLGEVVGAPISSYLGGKIGNDINGNKVYEPRDADKGDAARRLFYECICYTGVPYSGPANTNVVYATGAASWSLPKIISNAISYGQDQEVLKKWNNQDPPSNFEIARNDYIDQLQNNRNPFIDNPDYACFIDFSTMGLSTATTAYCFTRINNLETASSDISISPNPAADNVSINYNVKANAQLNISLLDLNGRILKRWNKADIGNQSTINVSEISNGIYFLQLNSNTATKNIKLVVAH
ncbi:MAG: endonuclease, partial [Pseudomonadota bacterium]